ncbi:MAG: C1 family peptidase [Bacteroidales bacterium]|nr:C1 family peptidase [Bacteroidales bacterium]
MKRFIFFSAALLCLSVFASAQQRASADLPEYTFTTVKAAPITPVKNQASSGTCWSFSAISFLESEAIRLGNIQDESKYPDFSEFYVVSNSYKERAEKFIRLDGKLGFSAGSGCGDVMDVVKNHGIVPNAEMTGMNYGSSLPQQAEMDAVLLAYVEAVAKTRGKLSTAWKRGFDAVVDEYLGKAPETFVVDGKTYTPASYRDAMKINADDYVELTSFTHHPFYTWFALEVCDNWRGSQSYNVPIDELMAVLDNALENGYTVCWGADVSHTGFTRGGLAILVDVDATQAQAGSDQEHWVGKEEGKPNPKPIEIIEAVPTQESRQIEFDNKTMTDDHGMHIYGIAKDQNGKKYYMVKNSWGETGAYKGLWYATEAFVKAQTLDITVHKSALTKDLKKRLNVK